MAEELKRSEKRFLWVQRITFTLLLIILFIFGLTQIRNFLAPIAFGFLLAYLLYPLARKLEQKHVSRILANLILIFGALFMLAGIIIAVYAIITPLALDLPALREKALENLSAVAARIGEYFGFNSDNIRQRVEEGITSIFQANGQIEAFFTATTSTLVAIGLLPVYIFLFLYYRTKFMFFLLKIAGKQNKPRMITILRDLSTVMVQYLTGVIVVVFILCFINSAGLWIIGVSPAIPLGVIAAFFNFIPYFGTLLGGLVPFTYAFIIEGELALAFRVVILFIIVQFTENNILTPNIVGGNVSVSPFFVIIGLVAASMIWGIAGMLLVVPFLAATRIILYNIEFMKPYAYLLGEEGTERHAISKEKIKRFFKKKLKKAK